MIAPLLSDEYGIDGDIIPMSCIVNNGDQDPSILINGFGEGYGDARRTTISPLPTTGKSSVPPQQGYRAMVWTGCTSCMPKLIDPECFTQEWSTYVSKEGKAGRYGVCFG